MICKVTCLTQACQSAEEQKVTTIVSVMANEVASGFLSFHQTVLTCRLPFFSGFSYLVLAAPTFRRCVVQMVHCVIEPRSGSTESFSLGIQKVVWDDSRHRVRGPYAKKFFFFAEIVLFHPLAFVCSVQLMSSVSWNCNAKCEVCPSLDGIPASDR